MIKRFVLILSLAVIPAVAACGREIVFDEEGFRVERSVPAALTLINGTPERVFYFVVDQETLALINWAPCIDPHQCVGIDPGERVQVSYAQIAGYQPGSGAAVVFWWLMVPDGPGRHRADRMRSIVVEL